MAYRLRRKEPVAAALCRLVDERVESAVAALGRRDDPYAGIHDARKDIKKLRALLRLYRGALGADFARANRTLRDIGRSLAGSREAQAAVETVDKLADRYPEQAEALRPLRERLMVRRDRWLATEAETPAQAAARELQAFAAGMRGLQPARGGFAAIGPGLRRTYRDARRAFAAARAEPAPERFHEWRKRVKDDWYHTRLLEPVWPAAMKARRKALKALSDLLGDDHDLVVLQDLLASGEMDGPDADLAADLAGQRRAELQATAYGWGSRLYADKPGPYRRRLKRWWRAWRRGD